MMRPWTILIASSWLSLAAASASASACAAKPSVAAEIASIDHDNCEHGPNSRGCWGDYSINTNYYEQAPDTGVTREYWFVVENITMAPDGYEQHVLAINRSIPGPLIEANWGDEVVIHVTNNMERNGTAIHWHGIRQLNNNAHDGVPGVTQCPIPPGGSYTYRWKAEQYGTSWYHSHFSLQYSVGLQGPMIIHGPATANYDEDLGTVMLQDWSHVSPFAMWWYARVPSGPPSLSNSLINGKNIFRCTDPLDKNCLGTGERSEWHFEKGKRYRMRLVNTGLYSNFRFAIDGHNLTVIANDFVPIEPYTTDNVIISMGQRYDVIVEANAPEDNYWLRAIWQTSCCPNDYANDTLGIIRYDPQSTALPNTTHPALHYPDNCDDEPAEKLVPHVKVDAGPPARTDVFNLYRHTYDMPRGFMWTLNDTYLWIDWSKPTNLLVAENDTTIFPPNYLLYHTPDGPNQWVYIVFNDISERNRSHPMHLHGHDFFLLGTGEGNFTKDSPLQLKNPPRRDTASWPKRGYMVFAYKTDNPGAWLIHCHIAWHSSQGLGMQMLERPGEMTYTEDEDQALHQTCQSWNKFYESPEQYIQEDSGI
ncbi:laccase 2 [Beauveria bassiana ARSEF 2860]|uniref:Oxidoreductase OpS5 n=1 Tax=Beauveria bassiana (strain ARSEF 2860) TaxID=655819 RepID=OPS5_BEAB2|nr:laccase 2 [Beauveria bassiana ARSEF 2860]J5JH35.1 RecName: Full=Oxidoreductase OpS5; AltName: Full=Laccase OpS5; AltName: Full=Oosporein biosynthesis protein 5; Flags: Precursor [Beauveria bassiana ARSEF 2860]EJP62796.1 laccase 2 [Beauveria bassiana ARSEF 2860]